MNEMYETAYKTEMDKMRAEVIAEYKAQQRVAKMAAQSIHRLEGLRKMCDYAENSSATCIIISQDNCTRTWRLTVGYNGPLSGERHYYGYNFNGVIDAALEVELGNQQG